MDLFDTRSEATPVTAPQAPCIVAARPVATSLAKPRKPRGIGPAKLFVLDTNVLMHDPMSPLPLRGARHLPADDHARGARRSQEGHERSGAQRAPGQPRPRCAGRGPGAQRQRRDERRPAAGAHRASRGRRQAFLPDQPGRSHIARRPAAGQGGQPDPRRRPGAARAAAGARSGARVQRHQHAHQGACARPAGRGLLQRQDARRRRPALHRRAAAAGRLLGPPRQDHGELEPGRPDVLPHRRPDGAAAARQPVRVPRGAGRGTALRQGHRDHRQDRGAAARSRSTPTPRTRCGASRHATANRTSRSTC